MDSAPLPEGSLHVTWDAYFSRQEVATLAAAYLETLGAESHRVDGACETWRFPLDDPEHLLEVCPVTEKGPWNECEPVPAEARSIILISTMVRLAGDCRPDF